jgi:IS66 Orf2 like protein
MRRQIDGLVGLLQNVLHEDTLSGTLYVFCNRRRNACRPSKSRRIPEP